MDLRLVISLALCHLVWGRPQLDAEDAGLQEAISNLQLLNQIMIDNTLADQTQLPKLRKPVAALPSRPALQTSLGNQKVYSLDGAFSDIPSDAFKMEHRKEFQMRDENRVAKKDLSRHAHPITHARKEVDKVPESLMQTCLNYFRGRSQPKPSSLELILNICTELLDSDGLEEFTLDDEKRQRMYDFRAEEGAHHHHAPDGSVQCACCPHGGHAGAADARQTTDDDDDDVRSETIINDILELFKPVGHRREWMVINSQNPDERLKTYVDLKK